MVNERNVCSPISTARLDVDQHSIVDMGCAHPDGGGVGSNEAKFTSSSQGYHRWG